MSAEVARLKFDGTRPAFDPGPEFSVDCLEGTLGRGVARPANAVKDAASRRLFFRFMAQKGVFQRDVVVPGVQFHCFGEAVASEFVLPYYQVRVGEILADIGSTRCKRGSFREACDGGLI